MSEILFNGLPVDCITYPADAAPPVVFAAGELRKYLDRSTGVSLPVRPDAASSRSLHVTGSLSPRESEGLFETGSYDRSTVFSRDGSLLFAGENEAAALYAVYDFLQDYLGIRFFAPGEEHEYVPRHGSMHIPEGYRLDTGSEFAVRHYCTNDPATLEFAARNRVNATIFSTKTINNRPANSHAECTCKAFLDACSRLGIKIQGPGHMWSEFIPDAGMFGQHPEYFPFKDGQRAPNGRTACFSNPEVRRIFMNNLRRYLKNYPFWDIFAFWAEDVSDKQYCECPECGKLGISDWYILLANEAAAVVEEELPEAVFEIIAYHGTRRPPASVRSLYRNGENMLLNMCLGYTRDLYSPLEQKSPPNAEVLSMYEDWRRYLAEANYRGQIMVMDYYNLCERPNYGPRSRALLWPMDVIRRDVQFYREQGINGVGDFLGFDRMCWPSPFNVWCWLRLWNNPDRTLESLKDDFYPKYFGQAAGAVRQYMDRLEDVMYRHTSETNIRELQDTLELLEPAPTRSGDDILARRLKLVRIHHEYCLLLKRIFLACLQDDETTWKSLGKEYHDFFERTHLEDLSGHVDIPLSKLRWYARWYDNLFPLSLHMHSLAEEYLH